MGLLALDTIQIYVGQPPLQGTCLSSVETAFAVFDTVTLSLSGWTDNDGIAAYAFSYSYDGGDIYIPIQKPLAIASTVDIIFPPLYSATDVKFRCQGTDAYDLSSNKINSLNVLPDPS